MCIRDSSPPSYSKHAASSSAEKKVDGNWIWGCTHRSTTSYRKGASGKTYQSHVLGWFGNDFIIRKNQQELKDNHRAYQFCKGHDSWTCSFALVYVQGINHSVEHILINNGACVVGGNYYSMEFCEFAQREVPFKNGLSSHKPQLEG